MKLQKTALTLALAAALNTGVSQADIISFEFEGLTTMLDPAGIVQPKTNWKSFPVNVLCVMFGLGELYRQDFTCC